MIAIKLNDVFMFLYKAEIDDKMIEAYHCFDGQIVAKEKKNGNLYLEDTYFSSNENKTFTLKEAEEKGTLTFKCNLCEITYISERDQQYYDDNDIVNLSYQHHSYKRFAIKNGTEKSKEKMLKVLNYKIEHSENTISFEAEGIKRTRENIEKVKKGNLDIIF